MIEINSGNLTSQYEKQNSVKDNISTQDKAEYKSFKERMQSNIKRDFPYQKLADENGQIVYNGVVYNGDADSHSLTLGDVSDKSKVLSVKLSSGQYLRVNVDNIGDLNKSIGMFSGEDQGLILKALAQYYYEQDVLKQAEDEEENGIQSIAEKAAENSINVEALTAMEKLKVYSSNLAEKLLHGDTEEKIQIGGGEPMSNKEWDEMIEKFDEAQDVIKEAVKQDVEEQKQKKAKEEAKAEALLEEAISDSQNSATEVKIINEASASAV